MSASKPENLIKFLTPSAALNVLSTGRLRWSSPDCLGDPFELTSTSELGFDAHSLLDSTIKLASSMIFAPETPNGDSPLINAINRWRDEERFDSAEEANGVLRELLSKMVDYRVSQLQASMNQWQSFVRNARYCCFCTHPNYLGGWEMFAANHTGIALKFGTGEFSPFKDIKPVVYQAERAEFTNLREQLGAILHNRKDKLVDRFHDHHYVKSLHHKNDEEWRAYKTTEKIVPIDNHEPKSWYDDVPFLANDLLAVYFGLSTSAETKEAITHQVKENYNNTKIFQAVRSKAGFNIEFEKLKI